MATKKNTMVGSVANLVLADMKEKERCIVCHKKYKTYKKCYKPFKRGKGKKATTTMPLSPNIYIGKLTSHEEPYVLCDKCSKRVLRFIGVIPDKHDSKVFPQIHSQATDVKDFMDYLNGKKKTKWQLTFKSGFKNVPNKKGLYDRLLGQACHDYCNTHQTPYTPKQLVRVIKSYKNFPLEW